MVEQNEPTNKDAARTLNELIETCRDGEEGFRLAAADVRDMNLRELFLRYADQRARFAMDLAAAVRRLGREPRTRGTLKGKFFRAILRTRNRVLGSDTGRIVQWAEAGEDRALDGYRRALESALPREVRDLVQLQMEGVSEAHRVVSQLERRDSEADRPAGSSIPESPGGMMGMGPGGTPGHQV